jgi:hypothetical protein
MDDFYFSYSTSTLHYGVYLGVTFKTANATHSTLVIYAFLVTLTESFLGSDSTTFEFLFQYTYRSDFTESLGSVGDSTPFMTTSSCICQYPLYAKNFTKDDASTFDIDINYNVSGTGFDESGYYSTSKSLSTKGPSIPISPQFIILGLSLAVFINLLVSRRKLE